MESHVFEVFEAAFFLKTLDEMRLSTVTVTDTGCAGFPFMRLPRSRFAGGVR